MIKDNQKLHDFVQDIKLLSEQYGWSLTESLDLIGYKPKTEEELMLEIAQELYKEGVVFIPVGKKRQRISSGRLEVLYDRIWCWEGLKMHVVYEPTTKQWADVVNLLNQIV